MNTHDQEKVRKFMNDVAMSQAVYNVLLQSFLKTKKQSDVNFLAASRIAIDLLGDAWKELEHLKSNNLTESKTLEQVGL